jgi:hypothetical protein
MDNGTGLCATCNRWFPLEPDGNPPGGPLPGHRNEHGDPCVGSMRYPKIYKLPKKPATTPTTKE